MCQQTTVVDERQLQTIKVVVNLIVHSQLCKQRKRQPNQVLGLQAGGALPSNYGALAVGEVN